MHTQAKTLRTLLEKVGIKRDGKRPSVRTGRRYIGNGQYEWTSATAHTNALTDEQVAELKQLSKWVEIYNCPECRFAIVTN